MKKTVRFSKDYKGIFNLKTDFYNNNKSNLINANQLNKIYLKGPLRKICKNCQKKISNFLLKSFGVKYSLCKYCGHINGEKEETKFFFYKLYVKGAGSKNIEKNYKKFFKERVKLIYNSKALFLKKIVKKKITVLEVGSGAGHFLKALENNKIFGKGIEPNKLLCKVGNQYLKKNKLINHKFSELKNIISNEKTANCLAAIGVLEHIENPNEFLKLFKKSKIKYLYISVPLFSLTSLVENSFENVYPRHLSGGHTHLYTKKSIYYFAKKYKFKVIGEWWFGTDIADLYRSILVSSKNLNKDIYKKVIDHNFYDVLNEMQECIDKKKICSEVHMVLSK